MLALCQIRQLSVAESGRPPALPPTTGEFQAFQNYSVDHKFEEFFRLLRHDSCFYFMTAALDFDTDYYYEFYDQFHLSDNIDEPIDGSDTDEY